MRIASQDLFVAAAALFLAAWMGYRRGYESPPKKAPPEMPVQRSQFRTEHEEAVPKTKPETLQELARKRLSERGSAAAWEIISGYSLDQVKRALAEPDRTGDPETLLDQRSMLYFRWAALDPLAAMTDAAGKEPSAGNSYLYACQSWFRNDPDAAYRWGISDEGKQKFSLSSQYATRFMESLLSRMPLEKALEKATSLGMDRDGISRVWQGVATDQGTTPEDRKNFLAKLPELEKRGIKRAALIGPLVWSWQGVDAADAVRGIGSLGLSEVDEKKMIDDAVETWTRSKPEEALAWTLHPANERPMDEKVMAYTNLEAASPEESARRFSSLSSTPGLQQAVLDSSLRSYYQMGVVPYGDGFSMDHSPLKQLTENYQRWHAASPEEASRWLENTSSIVRKKLTPSSQQ